MPEDAGAGRPGERHEPGAAQTPEAGRIHPPAGQADQARDVLNELASSLFDVGVLIKAAADLPGDESRLRITEALSRLDDAVQAARDHVSTEHSREVQSRLASSPLTEPGRLRWSADRAALLRERVVHTVRALQGSAADTAALLEQRGGLVRKPGRTDYRAEVKRWRAFADQAEQMAERLEQEP